MEIEGRSEFYWARPVEPPVWITAKSGSEVLRMTLASPDRPIKRYEPLKVESGVWLQLSEIGAEEDVALQKLKIASFAESYGPLHTLIPPHNPKSPPSRVVIGESLLGWQRDSRDLHQCVRDYREANENPEGARQRSLEWLRRVGGEFSQRAMLAWESLTIEQLKVRNLQNVLQQVNNSLSRFKVEFGLSLDERTLAVRMDIIPTSLLGCIWLQFARAIEGDKVYHQCENCKKYFEVGSNQTGRSDKRFCTPTCKANAHRKLKQEIVELHAQGVSVREIAKRTGKDIEKVKEWVRS